MNNRRRRKNMIIEQHLHAIVLAFYKALQGTGRREMLRFVTLNLKLLFRLVILRSVVAIFFITIGESLHIFCPLLSLPSLCLFLFASVSLPLASLGSTKKRTIFRSRHFPELPPTRFPSVMRIGGLVQRRSRRTRGASVPLLACPAVSVREARISQERQARDSHESFSKTSSELNSWVPRGISLQD